MNKPEMARAIVERCRRLTDAFGSNWLWGSYYQEFSNDCGIPVGKPEPGSRKDGRNPVRMRFSRALRQIIPMDDYSMKEVITHQNELVDAILSFHGKSLNDERDNPPRSLPANSETRLVNPDLTTAALESANRLTRSKPTRIATAEISQQVLDAISSIGVHEMWEDNRNPSCVRAMNLALGGQKRRYPRGAFPGECDVVTGTHWMEIKFAWTYTTDLTESVKNPVFNKHLFSISPGETSAVKDVTLKLRSLMEREKQQALGSCWSVLTPMRFRLIWRLSNGLKPFVNLMRNLGRNT